VSILPLAAKTLLERQKHCYFALRRTQLVELVMWQGWYAWISVSSLSCDLKS